jgi:putative protease
MKKSNDLFHIHYRGVSMKREDIELLSPAGTWEALEAAVYAGADAVYLGGSAFGARAYAENFGPEEMQRAIVFAHLHHVRIYVTVNTLVTDEEMPALGEYVCFLSNIGVDGIIVQDMGIIRLCRKVVPELPLHASTQMTVTNSAGAVFTYHQGMSRAVIAREASLKDIKKVCETTPGEIETFMHGALCVCYSGQCLMSSLIGGRSGNRGRCAQPCRLPYTLVNKEGKDMLAHVDAGHYLLSPKDMNTLDILPQLIETGVRSFKIEGRMKRPEYVAVVTDIYRRAIDSYFAGHYMVPEEDREHIEQIFNRDFTTAYLEKRPGRTMMSDRRPNNRGVLLGRVTALSKDHTQGTVKLDKDLHIGDGLEFWVSVGGRVGTTVEHMTVSGEARETAFAGEQVTIAVPRGIRMNDRVFRTNDQKLMEYAARFFGPDHKRRIPLDCYVTARLGEPMSIVMTDDEGHVGEGRTKFIVETARKHALDEATVRKQVDRLGTTEFCLGQLVLTSDDNVMVPMSEINEARRLAVEAVMKARLDDFLPPRKKVTWNNGHLAQEVNHSLRQHAELTVHVDTLDKARAALTGGADVLLVGGDSFSLPLMTMEDYKTISQWVREKGKKWYIATSRIVSEGQLDYFRNALTRWAELKPDGIMAGNNGLVEMILDSGLPLWLDWDFNTFNSQSILFWQEVGAKGITLSPELTMTQVEGLAKKSPLPLECLVEGSLEMMVSEYCVEGSFLGHLDQGKCSFNCREEGFLEDRKKEHFPLKQDQFGRMHVLNGRPLSMLAHVKNMEKSGLARLRYDARNTDLDSVGAVTAMYRGVLDGMTLVEDNEPGTTRGHYFRGVL